MKYIKTNINKTTKQETFLVIEYLKKGKVVACPTDTIYGLSCRADSRKAISKVRKIKSQAGDKPLLALVSSLAMAKKYCHISKEQEKFLKKVWPGPVTVILKSKGKLPGDLSGGSLNLAIRLPKNDFLIRIIKGIGLPIVSTSLNMGGGKPLSEVKNLKDYFKVSPDLVINAGKISRSKPSKLIDLSDFNNIKVLRK